MEELNELKNLVIQTLEANGSLSNIRAQIRSSVFKVIDEPNTQKKVQICLMVGVALPLGKCEVPEAARRRVRAGLLAGHQGVLPVLQHGLYQLRVRIGGQCQGRS